MATDASQAGPAGKKSLTAIVAVAIAAVVAGGLAVFLLTSSNDDVAGSSAGQASFFEMRQVINSEGALGAAIVTAADVQAATAIAVPTGQTWAVEVHLDQTGAAALAEATTRLIDAPSPQNQLAIVVDGNVVSSPVVMAPITSGDVQITGGFTEAEAKTLADSLAAAAG